MAEPQKSLVRPRVMAGRRRLFAALVTVIALAACGGDLDGADSAITVRPVTAPNGTDGPSVPTTPPSPTLPSTPPLSATPLPPREGNAPPSMPGNSIDPAMPLVQAAVEDLARRLDVSPEEVTVVEALAVTWPDGGLGCPQPGMAYTQVPVDGSFVVLEAGERRYEYHGGDPLFLCEPGK